MAERYVKAEKITDKFTQAQIHTRSNSQGEENPQHAEPDLDWKAGKKEWAIVIVLAIVSLMIALDATILVTALPVRVSDLVLRQTDLRQAIASKLDGSATDTFWTGTSYLLTESVFQVSQIFYLISESRTSMQCPSIIFWNFTILRV